VRLISIPNVYSPNLIFILLLNSYSCSFAEDLKREFREAYLNSSITAIFLFHAHRETLVYPCDEAHSTVQCAEREWKSVSQERERWNFFSLLDALLFDAACHSHLRIVSIWPEAKLAKARLTEETSDTKGRERLCARSLAYYFFNNIKETL